MNLEGSSQVACTKELPAGMSNYWQAPPDHILALRARLGAGGALAVADFREGIPVNQPAAEAQVHLATVGPIGHADTG